MLCCLIHVVWLKIIHILYNLCNIYDKIRQLFVLMFCTFHLSVLLSIADPETDIKRRNRLNGGLTEKIQFWILTVVLSVVGSRVASLVVLEFSLRAISARITGGSV